MSIASSSTLRVRSHEVAAAAAMANNNAFLPEKWAKILLAHSPADPRTKPILWHSEIIDDKLSETRAKGKANDANRCFAQARLELSGTSSFHQAVSNGE